jgi:hypothetical protein
MAWENYFLKYVGTNDVRDDSGPASGFNTKIIVRHDIAEILLKVALNTIKQTERKARYDLIV